MQDNLYQAVKRWKAAWRELQALESNRIVRKDKAARIAALKDQIVRLQPLVNAWKSKTFFAGGPARNIPIASIADAMKAARRIQ